MRDNQNTHDIVANISSLQSGIDILKSEWKTNPEMVEKIIPLMIQKLELLQLDLTPHKEK